MNPGETLATAAVFLSLVAYSGVMVAFHVVLWLRRRQTARVSTRAAPGADGFISILKPLAGEDDDLAENLESFASLNGPPHEVLFGVASRTDPAHAVARRFIDRHPDRDARIVVTNANAALNPKVAQLIGLASAARGAVLVVSDSNVRVPPAYLADLVLRLEEPGCGLVTSLFVGTGERTIGAALENLQLASTITPPVVLSTCGPRPIAIGKSMAMWRRDIDAIGGFAAFGGFLAEDYMMGRRFVDAGLRVATSVVTVENRNVNNTVAGTFNRHARWTKMRRAFAPTVFLFEPLLYPILVAAAALAIVPSPSTAAALGLAVIVQTAAALLAVRVLRRTWLPWRHAPLEVVRSFLVLGCWCSALWSRSVTWRGHRMTIGRLSMLEPTTHDGRTIAGGATDGLGDPDV